MLAFVRPVVQLISLAGVQLEGCLLQREAAFALASSGFLPPARCQVGSIVYFRMLMNVLLVNSTNGD